MICSLEHRGGQYFDNPLFKPDCTLEVYRDEAVCFDRCPVRKRFERIPDLIRGIERLELSRAFERVPLTGSVQGGYARLG